MAKNIAIVCATCEAKLTPESKQYDKFKKQKVVVTGASGSQVIGILEWVDLYTLGVQVVGQHEPTIVYKGPGVSVALKDNR